MSGQTVYDISRRNILKTGATAATISLAGCSGGGNDSGPENNTGQNRMQGSDADDEEPENGDTGDENDGLENGITPETDVTEILDNVTDNQEMHDHIATEVKRDQNYVLEKSSVRVIAGFPKQLSKKGGGPLYLPFFDQSDEQRMNSVVIHPHGVLSFNWDMEEQETENILRELGLESYQEDKTWQRYKGTIEDDNLFDESADVYAGRNGSRIVIAAEDVSDGSYPGIITEGEDALNTTIETFEDERASLPEGDNPDDISVRKLVEALDKIENELISEADLYFVDIAYEEFASEPLGTDVKVEFIAGTYKRGSFSEKYVGVSSDNNIIQ